MIELKTTGTFGRSLVTKREKDSNEQERVICHAKMTELFIAREQIDELCRQPLGWHQALFDEAGAPVARLELGLPGREWEVTGTIKGTGEHPATLNLMQAELTGVVIGLTTLGAVVSGSLAWTARGDEVEDVTDLLGQIASIDWRVTDGEQKDLFHGSKAA